MESLKEKIIFTIMQEIDVYINLVQEEVIKDRETIDFINRVVLPRFNKLRDILHNYPE